MAFATVRSLLVLHADNYAAVKGILVVFLYYAVCRHGMCLKVPLSYRGDGIVCRFLREGLFG